MNWSLMAQIGERLLTLMMEVVAEERGVYGDSARPSPPARCAECGAEPWVIRWGTIRVGQQLDGYYYQATVGGGPKLLCRGCWHAAIGVDDPEVPKPR